MADRPVVQTGAAAPPDFTEETDLALARFGGRVVFATDGKLRSKRMQCMDDDGIDRVFLEYAHPIVLMHDKQTGSPPPRTC